MAGGDRTPLPRPVVHASTGLFALLLGVLSPGGAIACAVGGVLLGWVVFPLTGVEARLRRPGERFPGGLRTYPLAVLALVILLPPAEAAAAWAILAFGDAAACVVGERVPSSSVFGHKKATWVGTTAHLGVGGLAAWGMANAVGAIAATSGVEAGPVPSLAAAFVAAGAAVLVDLLLPLPDDNLPCAAAAGSALYVARGLL